MNEKEKLALSAFGIAMLLVGLFYAKHTVSLILFACDMTTEFGFRDVLGYLVATGVVSSLSVLAVPVFLLMGVAVTVEPWVGNRRS